MSGVRSNSGVWFVTDPALDMVSNLKMPKTGDSLRREIYGPFADIVVFCRPRFVSDLASPGNASTRPCRVKLEAKMNISHRCNIAVG